jgi:hypothetical protein
MHERSPNRSPFDESSAFAEAASAPLTKKPKSSTTRLREGLQLWSDARKASAHPDSIFIWIPKNGGTSVYTVLQKSGLVKLNTTRSIRLCFHNSGRVTFGHMDIGALVELDLISPDFVRGSFKFAFSRDPYTRAVSLYQYLCETIVLENWHRIPTFRDFLRILADGYYDRVGAYNQRGLSQCNPQVEWLRFAWPDKVYKIENMDEFSADIKERWGISPDSFPHLNQSRDNQIELEAEDKALIEKIYAEDFDSLEYMKR